MSGIWKLGIVALVLLAVACSAQTEVEEPTKVERSSLEEYLSQLEKPLNKVNDTMDAWTAHYEANVDNVDISIQEATSLMETQLDLARRIRQAAFTGITTLMETIPPEKCQDAHLVVLEALQLILRGILLIQDELVAALQSRPVNDEQINLGNELLGKSNIVKQRGIGSVLQCQ